MVIYEKFTQDRMAAVMSIAAVVSSGSDQQKAADFLKRFMDFSFPEVEGRQQVTTDSMMKELKAFSEKEVMLVPGKSGFSLQMNDKKKG